MKTLNSLSFDITYKCTYRCKHCFNSSGNRPRNLELTDEQVRKIVHDIAAQAPDSMCICGGEPLLRKNVVYNILEIMKKESPSTILSMVTNGSFMTEEIAQHLKKRGIGKIQISLDGAQPESHDWLRQKGAFYSAVNALKILKNVGIDHAVAFSPNRKNIKELPDTIELAQSLGCTELRSQPLMILGRALEHREEFNLSYEEYMSTKILMDQKNEQYFESGFTCEWGDPLSHLRIGREEALYNLIITATGRIMASPYIPISFGNIRKHSIKEYLDAGLLNVLQTNKLAIAISDKITSVDNMALTDEGFSGKNDGGMIDLDLLHDDYMVRTELYFSEINNHTFESKELAYE